jgi:death-on-curing protein
MVVVTAYVTRLLVRAPSCTRGPAVFAQGDLFELAAAYAFHLPPSQASLDGNKRTGMAAALTFMELNGNTVPRHRDELYAAMIAIA